MLRPTITFAAALSLLGQLCRGWGGIGAGVTPALLLAIAVGIGIRYVPRGARASRGGLLGAQPVPSGGLAVNFMLPDVLGPVGPAPFLYCRF